MTFSLGSPLSDSVRHGLPDTWEIRGGRLSLHDPAVVGILNVTPDSFSDGGRFLRPDLAVERARDLVAAGADVLDVGGESTRPGAAPVSADEELARVIPVIERLRASLPVPVSVDTSKAVVAAAALHAGAAIVNDVSALADPEMGAVVAGAGAGLVLMHRRGTPRTMQHDPWYADVVTDVASALQAACARADNAGIPAARVIIDPGIGFGKTAEHNWQLIAGVQQLRALGRAVMIGPSRKGFLGALLGGVPPEERAVATAAACVAGFFRGARIFRVHDVLPVRQALAVAGAVLHASPELRT